MNTKNAFLKLKTKRDEERNIANLSEDTFHSFLENKIRHLHSVGKSVIGKTLGQDLTSFDFKAFPLRLKWLLIDSFIIEENSEGFFKITQAEGDKKSSFVIPKDILFKSDRDFASMVRREIKDSRVRAEASNIRNNEIIADLELLIKIKKAELEFHKLRKF